MEWLYGLAGGALIGVAMWRLAEATRDAAEHTARAQFKALEARIQQLEAELKDLKRKK